MNWLKKVLSSSIGKKVQMGISGLLLCGFLVAHLGGNLLLFVRDGGHTYNCQGIDIPAEGLIHSTTFDDDRYDYDAVSHTITARRSGHRFRLGDKIRVVIAHVDVDRRQLDFRLAGSRSAKLVRDRKASGEERPRRDSRHPGRSASRPDQPRRRKRR